MNKAELAAKLAERSNLTKSQADGVISALFGKYGPGVSEPGIISQELQSGGEVSLVGFGTFKVAKRASRTARNPKTGEWIEVAAKNAPAFKVGAALKKEVL
jgi:DNA-binding protein HU-beta